jgi:hypothetical protein
MLARGSGLTIRSRRTATPPLNSSVSPFMTSFRSPRPLPSLIAIWIVGWLSFGALVTGLDLVLHFLPMHYPAFQYLHSASLPAHLFWVGTGVIGVASAYVLSVRSTLGVTAVFAFSVLYVAAAPMIWRQFTFGCWAAISASLFACIGAWRAWRANQSSKRARVPRVA